MTLGECPSPAAARRRPARRSWGDAIARVESGSESDRAPSRDVVERAAAKVEPRSARLPVGAQVAGRPWREDVVLAIMAALERHFRATPGYPVLPP
jgi:hypothetical protein